MIKSHQQQPDRFDSGPDRRHIHQQQEYATWFRGQFRWNWYITLTFSREVSSEQATVLLNEYLRGIEELTRAHLSCLIAKEQTYSGLGKPTGRVHFHQLVSGATALTEELLRDCWQVPQTDVLDVNDMAALLHIHAVTVRLKAAAGEIPGRQIGNRWRFSRAVIMAWLASSSSST
jgi:excisionase family DNA binding protein